MKTSNMDYKKKYKEALEKIRSLHRDYNQISTLIDVKEELENIFPELAESEDEKIKQELIEYHKIQAFLDGKPNNKHVKFVAWLEKRGESVEINPTEFDTRLQALIGKFDSLPKEELMGSLSFWMNVVQNDGTYKSDEKQGEHDSIEEPNFFDDFRKTDSEVEPKFKVGDIIRHKEQGCTCKITAIDTATAEYGVSECNGTHLPFDFEDAWELVEQKPAEWSEEDEKMLSDIVKDLVHPWNEYIPDRIEEEIKWLKNKLKSLRLQSHWKPSYVQMEVLLSEVTALTEGCNKQIVLKSLYNDLKKLKA